jgi:hypothetical protein
LDPLIKSQLLYQLSYAPAPGRRQAGPSFSKLVRECPGINPVRARIRSGCSPFAYKAEATANPIERAIASAWRFWSSLRLCRSGSATTSTRRTSAASARSAAR